MQVCSVRVSVFKGFEGGLGNPKIERKNAFALQIERKEKNDTEILRPLEDNIYMLFGRKSEASILRAR